MSKKHSKSERVTTRRRGRGQDAAKADPASVHATSGKEEVQTSITRDDDEAQLHMPQVELVKLQRHFTGCGDRILVILEGRDADGKDGSIKRIVEYLSPRETRVVAC